MKLVSIIFYPEPPPIFYKNSESRKQNTEKALPLHPEYRNRQSMKATIDFGKMKISGIFWKMLIPTLLGGRPKRFF